MRRRNWRVVIAGLFLALMAGGFFLIMLTVAPQSTDPAEMMRTRGLHLRRCNRSQRCDDPLRVDR